MINLRSSIETIESLLQDGSTASLTYAALECRLAIERICYERLRLSHDYISHSDLKRWPPRDIVNTLIQEVDPWIASSHTLSISREPCTEDSTNETPEDIEFVPVGTQAGFNPNKLGKLWNALANLALHINIPENKDVLVPRYGNSDKIRAKVLETLEEIKSISTGTLITAGFGEVVTFHCGCGAEIKRRSHLLRNGQIVSCIDPRCDESYEYEESSGNFWRRAFNITCRKCDAKKDIPKKMVENLRTDKRIYFNCEGCMEEIQIHWRPMQTQNSAVKTE